MAANDARVLELLDAQYASVEEIDAAIAEIEAMEGDHDQALSNLAIRRTSLAARSKRSIPVVQVPADEMSWHKRRDE